MSVVPGHLIVPHKAGPKVTPPEVRFWRHVDKRGPLECWPWTGSVNRKGYGMFGGATFNGRRWNNEAAHRMSVILARGPIPEGKEVDHTCKNRSCVNPAHLEVVDHVENIARGLDRKTHCRRGHSIAEFGEFLLQGKWRACNRCHRLLYERSLQKAKDNRLAAKLARTEKTS